MKNKFPRFFKKDSWLALFLRIDNDVDYGTYIRSYSFSGSNRINLERCLNDKSIVEISAAEAALIFSLGEK